MVNPMCDRHRLPGEWDAALCPGCQAEMQADGAKMAEMELARAERSLATMESHIREALDELDTVRRSMRCEILAPYRVREERVVRILTTALLVANRDTGAAA